jgi:hypothetical protein
MPRPPQLLSYELAIQDWSTLLLRLRGTFVDFLLGSAMIYYSTTADTDRRVLTCGGEH